MKAIKISGARVHNLKSVSCQIPKEEITVISGISGSGKSSLAFDTIFAEGQRRYVENLSSYAKQVIGVVEKPDVDSIEGIPPAIAIDQKSVARSPRSTVGTLTEMYDYLRLLFARFGTVKCPKCNSALSQATSPELISDIIFHKIEELGLPSRVNPVRNVSSNGVKLYATVVRLARGNHRETIEKLFSSRYKSFQIDGIDYSREDLEGLELSKTVSHTIEVLISRFDITEKPRIALKNEILKAVKEGFGIGSEILRLVVGNEVETISKQPFCARCSLYFPLLQPRLFSFNSPYGACPDCQGLGLRREIDPNAVIPNQNLTVSEGAIRPWARMSTQNNGIFAELKKMAREKDFTLDRPVCEYSDEVLRAILFGANGFEGVVNNLERKYRETDSDYLRAEIEQYMVERLCESCRGERLNEYARSVKFLGKTIWEISNIEVDALRELIETRGNSLPIEAGQVTGELLKRLRNLSAVGLGYLTLSRTSETLSGGEAQRIKLGVQFDSFLSGALYVLDEPTISLHSADTQMLISAFSRLKQEGNTVVIVEHDKSVLESADYVIDMGPGAGRYGGQIIAQGRPEEIKKDPASITGQYLSGRKQIDLPQFRRKPNGRKLRIIGANHNNLKNLNVEIPLNLFISVTGVSGSGKSSLVYDILAKDLSKSLHRSEDVPGECRRIEGLEHLDKVIRIDQSPIGRTPRSNLATYTGLFTPIRELFSQTPEAKHKGFLASQFSFNLKGGRCEVCRGDGSLKVEMFFMGDVYVPCEECQGKRYNQETLEVKVSGKTITDVLDLSVDEAGEFFEGKESPEIEEILCKIRVLKKVGLGYLPLGQSATTLSGGEAQRIKLATELSRPSTGQTVYILDEPTTGLHFEDISKLLKVLQELVDRGNTVLVIEHNLDVIKSSDWVIDMGPGAGAEGGQIVACGTPEEIAATSASLTGKFLKKELK